VTFPPAHRTPPPCSDNQRQDKVMPRPHRLHRTVARLTQLATPRSAMSHACIGHRGGVHAAHMCQRPPRLASRVRTTPRLHLLKGGLLSMPVCFTDHFPFGNGELAASPISLPRGHHCRLSLTTSSPREQVKKEVHIEAY
jgi:hypothetical protein